MRKANYYLELLHPSTIVIRQGTRFTEYEIVQLWSSFKRDFPKGRINRQQLRDLIRSVFPRSLPDLVLDNIFRMFDPERKGPVRNIDLLLESMSQTHIAILISCILGRYH